MNHFHYSSLLHFIEEYSGHICNIRIQYMKLLSQLTKVEVIGDNDFIEMVKNISKMGKIVICYMKDNFTKQPIILGTGTVFFEPKLIHGCLPVGHIEDIVVHESYRSLGIASEILRKLVELAKYKGCYKVILDCDESLINVYKTSGFEKKGVQMARYFTSIKNAWNV